MIIERKPIELNNQQKKLVSSGWGAGIVETTVTEKIIYNSDGFKVLGYISYPKETNGKIPCIVWNRGGFRKRGVIDDFNAVGIFGKIASWGYVVFASMYRGSIKGEGIDLFGGKDLNDILNIIPIANEFPFADKNKWGIEGWSRGGMMTYLALMQTNIFKCAVITGGISNLIDIYQQDKLVQINFNSIFCENLSNELYNRSAYHFYNKLPKDVFYLIMHGASDETVPFTQSTMMATKLIEDGYKVRLMLFENGDHFLKKQRPEVDIIRKSWYERFLKG